METLRFWQVDAFTRERYCGNPAAIVFDADALSSEQMQTIARQFNLSETVFFCAPSRDSGADYRVRIFTPGMEIPFAGHPTIASAFVFFTAGNRTDAPTSLRQECGAGVIPIDVTTGDAPLFTLAAPAEPTVETSIDRDHIARMLGREAGEIADEPAEICSIGLPWLIARVGSLEALRAAEPDLALIETICREHRVVGITVYSTGAVLDGCSLHVRTFAPAAGIREDPVCGSGNGAVAVHVARYLHRDMPAFSYRAEQGLEVHRRGILHLAVERGEEEDSFQVRLGGNAVKVLEGRLWT